MSAVGAVPPAASLHIPARSAAPKTAIFAVSHSSAGGAQELWSNLATGFAERGYQVTLLSLYPGRTDARRAPGHLPWTCLAPARPKSALALLAMLGKLLVLLRRTSPDAIFTAMPAVNVLLPLAARLIGHRTIMVTAHHAPVDTNGRMLNWIDSLLASTGLVTRIVSVSHAVNATLAGKPSRYRAKSLVIHNALPPDIERRIANLAERHPHDAARGRTIVATGRLAAQKNYPVLIRALAHLPNVTLRIVGTGAGEAGLKSLANSLGVAGRIDFLGFRQRESTLEILAEGDVFVQPSLFEGHSLALLEAAKLGLPIVVSNVPSQIEEVTADGVLCGLPVDTHDHRALASAIAGLLGNPAIYADYAARARRLGTARRYQTMIESYLALCQAPRPVAAHG